jgi:hypothetical protein
MRGKEMTEVKKEWYEDIPEHGVLCWVWDENYSCKVIEVVYEYNKEEMYSFIIEDARGYRNAKPMTLEEVKKYII